MCQYTFLRVARYRKGLVSVLASGDLEMPAFMRAGLSNSVDVSWRVKGLG
jgi:hypothetical protein